MENLKNKNIQIGILALLGVALLGTGAYYFFPKKTNPELEKQKLEEQVKNKEFGDLSEFIKTDLSEKQKLELKKILELRKQRQIQMKEILDDAYKNGGLEEAWSQVEKIREKCESRILPFVRIGSEKKFYAYCSKLAEKLEANYVQK